MLDFERLMPHAPARRLPLVCFLATLALVAASTMEATGSRRATSEVRALWVTRATMASPSAIADMVRSADAGGFNTLIVQVRARGDAYYASSLEPRASDLAARPAFDPLAETIAAAHGAGLRVHAWVVANLVSSAVALPASRAHVMYRQPDWLMVPRELAVSMLNLDPRSPEYIGRLARWTRARPDEVEGLYVSPIHPGAAKHVADIVGDLARRYEIDGVHLDYVRYPGEGFDYSRGAIRQFKDMLRPEMSADERTWADRRDAIDPLAYPALFPERWHAFRRARLTALVMRVRTTLKAARPGALLSVAVVPDVVEAYASRLQDWRTWLDQSLIDVVCPMAYTKEVDLFTARIAEAQSLAAGKPVWAGVGAYRLSPAETLRHIDAARHLKSAGVILFSYEALIAPPNSRQSFAQLSRAAFGDPSP
jgi:uncharacterized lipoprotein YddW (UPF0748 family)